MKFWFVGFLKEGKGINKICNRIPTIQILRRLVFESVIQVKIERVVAHWNTSRKWCKFFIIRSKFYCIFKINSICTEFESKSKYCKNNYYYSYWNLNRFAWFSNFRSLITTTITNTNQFTKKKSFEVSETQKIYERSKWLICKKNTSICLYVVSIYSNNRFVKLNRKSIKRIINSVANLVKII